MYKHFFKRVIDFTIALLALSVIWPILAIIALWLHVANKGAGAFFLQERPGLHGKIFKVIKFKSMTDEQDADGRLVRPEISGWAKLNGLNTVKWDDRLEMGTYYVEQIIAA